MYLFEIIRVALVVANCSYFSTEKKEYAPAANIWTVEAYEQHQTMGGEPITDVVLVCTWSQTLEGAAYRWSL